ncbi:AAA family ATPase [Streptomyces sp. NPDC005805]|uniref:AAA family ATPase n=1 Tax=Streptomyces sp. NPDC005805 TaxID=3157068 RepID=UPI0033F1AC4C
MTSGLIGRDHPAGVLRTEIGRATDSHGGLVLVTGEAGIGKTTLVTEAADEARRRGALVLGGSCWDSDSAPGYWPWVQVVRGLRRGAGPEVWEEAEKAAGGLLAVLLGEAQGEAEPAGPEPGGESFPLFDAVTTALVTVSQHRPVVVVLDDLHWADPASLRLLEFAAQHAWFERLLLIGTYRDVEVEAPDHPLQPLILPLAARAGATVTLTGLERDEVGALIAVIAGSEAEPALVDEVHRRTGGNPFFVEQTARIWHSGHPVTAIAPGVREAVRRRLALLPEPVGELLVTAAVLGREFHRQVLAAASSAPVPHVDRLLERAVAARLVAPRTGGRFAFAHDLVRETLYEALGEAEARSRHAAAVRALRDRPGPPGSGVPALPADLARHAYLAGGEVDRDTRVDLLVAAARDASGRLAAEEAIGHFRRAAEAAEGDARRSALVLLDLGGELRHAGEETEAWECFGRAADLAEELDAPELLARVAITLHSQAEMHGEQERRRTQRLLRDSYRRLVDRDQEELAGLSNEQIAQDLAVRCTALARDEGDDDALSFSLWARHDAIWGLGTAAERLDLTDEMADVARRTGNPEMELHATSMRWVSLLELGDPGFHAQVHRFVALAERAGVRRFEMAVSVDRSLVAGLTGRFDEARELLDNAMEEQHQHAAFLFMALHMDWAMKLLMGRLDEAQAVLAGVDETGHPYPRLLEALTAVERGEAELARRLVEELDALPEPMPRAFAPLMMRVRAQTAAATGDTRAIARSRAELEPYGGQWVVSLYGCDIGGPVDLWRGLLDAAEHRTGDAVAALTAAAESADRLQARPWAVRARAALAGVLAEAEGPAAARRLRGRVAEEARELGLTPLLPAAEPDTGPEAGPGTLTPAAVGHGPAPAPVAADPTAPRPAAPRPAAEPERPEFRRDGAVWALTFAGRSVHVPDAKGLRDLHTLLRHTGSDLSAVSLLAPEGGAEVVAARGLGGDAILDEEAKHRYRQHLDRLDEEIDRAAALGDTARVTAYEAERKALLEELRKAAGLGGRTRRLGDEAERARKTVTARIRDTLRRLDSLHPELAAHLRESVGTGSSCAYRPPQPVDWRL